MKRKVDLAFSSFSFNRSFAKQGLIGRVPFKQMVVGFILIDSVSDVAC